MKKKSKTQIWDDTRARLKIKFLEMGVTSCELCDSTYLLSFAHRLKRRFIRDQNELEYVALLCQSCHSIIEYSGHDNMYKQITKIVEKRK